MTDITCFDVLCVLSEYTRTLKWNLFVLIFLVNDLRAQNFAAHFNVIHVSVL